MNIKKTMLTFFGLMIFSCLYCTEGIALSVKTHRAINEYVAQNVMNPMPSEQNGYSLNGFTLDKYLIKNLGFTMGKDQVIKGEKEQAVFKHISDGGWFEDKPPEWYSIDWTYLRAFNHFYTPTTNSGLSGGPYDSTLSWALSGVGWVERSEAHHL